MGHEAAVELARWLNNPSTKLRWHFQCALNTNLFEDEDILLVANAFYACVHVRNKNMIILLNCTQALISHLFKTKLPYYLCVLLAFKNTFNCSICSTYVFSVINRIFSQWCPDTTHARVFRFMAIRT